MLAAVALLLAVALVVVLATRGAAALAALEKALPSAAGIELDDLLAPLDGEAGLTVTAGRAAPVFTLAARTRDEAATRESLASLQGTVSERLGGGPFEQRELHGADPFTLRATPRSSRPTRSRRAWRWPPPRARGWSSSARRRIR